MSNRRNSFSTQRTHAHRFVIYDFQNENEQILSWPWALRMNRNSIRCLADNIQLTVATANISMDLNNNNWIEFFCWSKAKPKQKKNNILPV